MNIFKKASNNYAALSDMDADSRKPVLQDSDEQLASSATFPSNYCYEPRPNTRKNNRKIVLHFLFLYGIIAVLLFYLIWKAQWMSTHDSCVELWSPAQHVVRYETVEFGKYFQNKSPYTQMPSKELDEKWEDLYNFGLSGLSKDEASRLYDLTAHLPHDDSTYVVTLAVFHQLHCVNHIRKALYPDEYPGLWQYNADGTVNHNTTLSLHWDHCLDVIRQAIACQSDITPMPFFYRERDDNIYSVLETTHYCRNFEDIKAWAMDRRVTHWDSNGNTKHADRS